MQKVLIANRGEISPLRPYASCAPAVTPATWPASPSTPTPTVTRCTCDTDEWLAWETPRQPYLDVAEILDVAARSGASAVHPGYGFLSENATLAEAVLDTGFHLDRPSAVGDRQPRRRRGWPQSGNYRAEAPLVRDGRRSEAPTRWWPSAAEHGLPVAIKAAYGGGGEDLKVARALEEIPERLHDSAVREAVAAFGRGECFRRALPGQPATRGDHLQPVGTRVVVSTHRLLRCPASAPEAVEEARRRSSQGANCGDLPETPRRS